MSYTGFAVVNVDHARVVLNEEGQAGLVQVVLKERKRRLVTNSSSSSISSTLSTIGQTP